MASHHANKRSLAEIKRLIERAVNEECRLPRPGIWFGMTNARYYGSSAAPNSRLRLFTLYHNGLAVLLRRVT